MVVLCVCLVVATPAPASLVSTLKMGYIGECLGLFSVFNSWISPSVQKLWREKANTQMGMYVPRPFLDTVHA